MNIESIIRTEWSFIAASPASAAMIALAGAAVGFGFGKLILNERMSALSERIKFKDEQIASLQNQLASLQAPEPIQDSFLLRQRLEVQMRRIAALEADLQLSKETNHEPETGSNANGSYLRFQDGTQECRAQFQVEATNKVITFPASFIERPLVNFFPGGIIDVVDANANRFSYTPRTSGQHERRAVEYVAIGRWR